MASDLKLKLISLCFVYVNRNIIQSSTNQLPQYVRTSERFHATMATYVTGGSNNNYEMRTSSCSHSVSLASVLLFVPHSEPFCSVCQ